MKIDQDHLNTNFYKIKNSYSYQYLEMNESQSFYSALYFKNSKRQNQFKIQKNNKLLEINYFIIYSFKFLIKKKIIKNFLKK